MSKEISALSGVRMLSAAEMGSLFGMTPNAIWHAAKAGRLPKPVKIGKTTRWLEDDVRNFINRQRGGS